VDTLAAPVTAGVREGQDISSFVDKFSGRARLGNYIQLFQKNYMVSQLQDAVESVGPAKIAEAEAKAIREMKRDIEATVAGTQDRAVEDGSTTAYALRGLGNWLASGGPADVPAAYRTPAASIHSTGTLTESAFNGLVASIFEKTGTVDALTLVAGTTLRRTISGFARSDGNTNENVFHVNQMATDKEITLSVNTYDSDFGIITIINGNPACMPSATTGYLINPDYVGVAELMSIGSTRLPNQGGGERGFIDAALTLQVYSPLAHGKITVVS
jgi:hypothetical protein